jgi:hypothetical protein
MIENYVVEHPDGTSASFRLDTSGPDGGWHKPSSGELFLEALPGTSDGKYQAVYPAGQWRSIRLAGTKPGVSLEDIRQAAQQVRTNCLSRSDASSEAVAGVLGALIDEFWPGRVDE